LFQETTFSCFSSPQYRICDYCNEKLLKESLMPNGMTHNDLINNPEAPNDVDLRFEIRAERLPPVTDTQSTS
jgi:hypothetical protein